MEGVMLASLRGGRGVRTQPSGRVTAVSRVSQKERWRSSAVVASISVCNGVSDIGEKWDEVLWKCDAKWDTL